MTDNAGQSAGSNEVSITLVDNPPVAVTLTVTDATGTSGQPRARLSWAPSEEYDFKEYRIYRATHANVTESDTLVATIGNQYPYEGGDWQKNDYPAAAPPPGTTYYYRIFVVDQADQSVGSNEQSVTLVDNPPAAVTLDDPAYSDDPMMPEGGVQLSWSANNEYDIHSYKVYRSTSPGVTEQSTLIATIERWDPSYPIDTYYSDWEAVPTTPPGTTYYYRVFVVDEAGQTTGSNEKSITLTNEPPVAVTLDPVVDISTIASGPRVQLSWSYSEEYDFKQYQLYRATHANVTQSDTLLTTINDMYPYDGDHWRYTDSPPDTGDPNLTYYYRVFVVDQADQATGSNEVDYVLPPGVPGMPTFNNINQTSVQATMPDLPVRATGMTLQMKLAGDPDSAYTDVATGQQAFASVTVDEMYASTDYTFRVVAVGPSGSTPGQSAGVSTADAPPPAPGAPTFSDLQPDSVVVLGPALPPSTDYLRLEIKLAGQDDSTYMTVADNLEDDSSTLVSGLSADANYEFRYVAVGRGGETPGASAQLMIPHVDYGWTVGTAIRCDGIRWPESNATITAGTSGRLSSFLARDWDARNMILGQTVIGSTVVTDPCSYTWSAKFADGTPAGTFPKGNTGQSVVWIAPATPGTVTLELIVDDQNSLNKGNNESGIRDDASLGYNDDPVAFTRTIVVQ